MTAAMVGAGAALSAGVVAWIYRGVRNQRLVHDRLMSQPTVAQVEVDEAEPLKAPKAWLRRYRYAPWVAGAITFFAVLVFAQLAVAFSLALAVMIGVCVHLLEDQRAMRRMLLVETQLAEAIDLMVASLSAGAGSMEAIESAADEMKAPMKDELESIVGQIRCGEDQREAFSQLAERIPLENFRLFAFTLAAHSDSGGSLAPTLSTVGESIRDRIELTRMARSQSAQSQASVIGILGITWFLGLMMWRSAPERFEEFVQAPIGSMFLAGAMMMQAVGLAWISKLSKLRF